MKTLLKFKSTITTEMTYPHCFKIEYVVEVTNAEDIFPEAYAYEEKLIQGKVVDETCECLGIVSVREAKFWELTALAKLGLQNI